MISFIAVAAALSQSADGPLSPRGRAAPTDLGVSAPRRFEALERSMREVLGVLLDHAGMKYLGVDPVTLEPVFELSSGRMVEFDDLPRSARHLVAFGAFTLRALAAAYPGKEVREAEAVVLLDDLEVHQDLRRERPLSALLARALPRVQWILTTGSRALALGCELAEVLALRWSSSGRVELHEGREAVMH